MTGLLRRSAGHRPGSMSASRRDCVKTRLPPLDAHECFVKRRVSARVARNGPARRIRIAGCHYGTAFSHSLDPKRTCRRVVRGGLQLPSAATAAQRLQPRVDIRSDAERVPMSSQAVSPNTLPGAIVPSRSPAVASAGGAPGRGHGNSAKTAAGCCGASACRTSPARTFLAAKSRTSSTVEVLNA